MEKRQSFEEPLIVKMRVFDIKEDAEIRSRVFDYNNIKLRVWFFKIVIWAIINGHAIELVAAEHDT